MAKNVLVPAWLDCSPQGEENHTSFALLSPIHILSLLRSNSTIS